MIRNRRGSSFPAWASPLIVGFLLLGFGRAAGADGLAPGSKAPDFRLALADGSGEIGLSDFLNKKIVIVHFWKSR
ncbi:MAG TPA: hypothetical protein VGB38_08435 [bacterium]